MLRHARISFMKTITATQRRRRYDEDYELFEGRTRRCCWYEVPPIRCTFNFSLLIKMLNKKLILRRFEGVKRVNKVSWSPPRQAVWKLLWLGLGGVKRVLLLLSNFLRCSRENECVVISFINPRRVWSTPDLMMNGDCDMLKIINTYFHTTCCDDKWAE